MDRAFLKKASLFFAQKHRIRTRSVRTDAGGEDQLQRVADGPTARGVPVGVPPAAYTQSFPDRRQPRPRSDTEGSDDQSPKLAKRAAQAYRHPAISTARLPDAILSCACDGPPPRAPLLIYDVVIRVGMGSPAKPPQANGVASRHASADIDGCPARGTPTGTPRAVGPSATRCSWSSPPASVRTLLVRIRCFLGEEERRFF